MHPIPIKPRLFNLPLSSGQSAFLWGGRGVGKSYWVQQYLPEAVILDMAVATVFAEYSARPGILREYYRDTTPQRIVVDGIDRVPTLLPEVQWLIENTPCSFLLVGRSPQKLLQAYPFFKSILQYTLPPLSTTEVEGLDLEQIMVTGLLPSTLRSTDPAQTLREYIGRYLLEEIVAPARVKRMPAFSTFLRLAAIHSGQVMCCAPLARESGVGGKVVRYYYQLLEETCFGFRLCPWSIPTDTQSVQSDKFYLLDVGLANHLARRRPAPFTPEYAQSLEHLLLMELKAYQALRNPHLVVRYWSTKTGLEVSAILGEGEVAIALKASRYFYEADAKALHALAASYPIPRLLLVSLQDLPSRLGEKGEVECLPWERFVKSLWEGEIVARQQALFEVERQITNSASVGHKLARWEKGYKEATNKALAPLHIPLE